MEQKSRKKHINITGKYRGIDMAVVKEILYPAGGVVRVHDDYAAKTEKEKKAILDAVSRIMTNHYRREKKIG